MKKKTKMKIALLEAANSDVRRIADQRDMYECALKKIATTISSADGIYDRVVMRRIARAALHAQGGIVV